MAEDQGYSIAIVSKVRHGGHYEINLKDVVSLCGERERLREWVSIVREVIGGM